VLDRYLRGFAGHVAHPVRSIADFGKQIAEKPTEDQKYPPEPGVDLFNR
jgi:hypothetical protein